MNQWNRFGLICSLMVTSIAGIGCPQPDTLSPVERKANDLVLAVISGDFDEYSRISDFGAHTSNPSDFSRLAQREYFDNMRAWFLDMLKVRDYEISKVEAAPGAGDNPVWRVLINLITADQEKVFLQVDVMERKSTGTFVVVGLYY